MFEVELKVRADHANVREALTTVDAGEGPTLAQVDTYYDAPHRDFSETGEAIRVRRTAPVQRVEGSIEAIVQRAMADDGQGWITYKGPLVDTASKTRAEVESGVDDPEAMDRILDRLGFSEAGEVRKLRHQYEWRGFDLSLDEVDGLGTFVEVETMASEAEMEATRDRARSLLRELGLNPNDQLRTSYLELLHGEE